MTDLSRRSFLAALAAVPVIMALPAALFDERHPLRVGDTFTIAGVHAVGNGRATDRLQTFRVVMAALA